MSHVSSKNGATRRSRKKVHITGLSPNCSIWDILTARPVESLMHLRRMGEVYVTFVNEQDAVNLAEKLDGYMRPPWTGSEDEQLLGQLGDILTC